MSGSSQDTGSPPDIVTISYDDLVRAASNVRETSMETDQLMSSLSEKIGRAYGDGFGCLGILAVTNVPDLPELRRSLLPLARSVAILPPSELDAVTVESSAYQVGWSHGKEKVEGNKFDTSKGSYYANPLTDDLVASMEERDRCGGNGAAVVEIHDLEVVARDNPAFFARNVWPEDSLPEFKGAFKDLGTLVCRVGRLVARHCDCYVAQRCPGYTPHKLESIITDSLFCKARLLHYFATDDLAKDSDVARSDEVTGVADAEFSDWCGWHNDHGSLTGLVPAMYLDSDGNEVECPDKSAGLYIKSRNGTLVHVRLPPDSLAFQIGETSQIHTGGLLQATPHAVRGIRSNGISGVTRESFAVFMEPEYFGDMDIPEKRTVEDTQRREVEELLPSTVRTLRSRWKSGMSFGDFSNATFAAFH